MKNIILIGICLYLVACLSAQAGENYTLYSPSGLITVDDPSYAKMYNIPISQKPEISPEQETEKEEYYAKLICFAIFL